MTTKAISQDVWDGLPDIIVENGDTATDAGLGGGTYRFVRTAVPSMTVAGVAIPALVTAPAITSDPPTVGVALTSTASAWSAPPAGFALEIQTRIILVRTLTDPDTELPAEEVTELSNTAQYTAQEDDFGADFELHREDRARFVNASTGVAGVYAEWQRSAGVAVVYPQIVFTVAPDLDQPSYTVGDTVTMSLGAAAGTLTVEVFSVDAVDRRNDLTGTGQTRQFDTTGETPPVDITFRVRAANPSTFVLSDLITVPLIAVAADITLRIVTEDAVLEGSGVGTISVVIASTPGFNDTRDLDETALPVVHIAPRIVQITDEGSTGTIKPGDLVGSEPPFTTLQGPGVVAFDVSDGAVALTHVWQRDTAGNGTFADIAGAPNVLARLIVEADQGNQVRRDDRVVQGATTVNNFSGPLAVAAAAVSSDMAADTSKFYWYDHADAIDSGGTLTSWPSKMSAGPTLAAINSLPLPTRNSSAVLFDGTQGIGDSTLAFADGLRQVLLSGGSFAGWIVGRQGDPAQDPSTTTQCEILREGAAGGDGTNQTLRLYTAQLATNVPAYSVGSGVLVRRFSNAALGDTPRTSWAYNSLILSRYVVTQTTWEITMTDGTNTETASGAVTAANFPNAGDGLRISGLITPTPQLGRLNGELRELFITTDAGTSNVNAITAELEAKYF